MQKLLLGAIIGGLTGLVLGAAFALGSVLAVDGLGERAANVVALCGGAAGFVGMFVGAVSGGAYAAGGGRARTCVAVIATAFGGGMAVRRGLDASPGGWPLVYAAAGASAAAAVLVCFGRWTRKASDSPLEPRRWRHWLQFRLSTLLALFVLVGALLSSLVSRTVLEVRAISQLRRHDAGVQCSITTPSWQSFLLGDSSGERDSAEAVHLRGPQIGDAELSWVRYLSDVRSITVSETKVTDAGLLHLRPLKRLESLSFWNAAITDAGLKHLNGLQNLATLDLVDARVTDVGLEHLIGLRHLKSLNLRGTAITDAGLACLSAFGELEHLDLAGTNITDAGLEHLPGIKRLKTLEMSFTKITDAGIPVLEGISTLQRVTAYGTQITPVGRKRLDQIYLKAEALSAASLAEQHAR